MSSRLGETAIVAAGLGYLLALSWAMTNLSYDIWGALVVIPVYGILGVAGLRRMFRGELAPVANAMCWGLLLKLGGALARYWVGFEAYGGGIDAGAYHEFAVVEAGEIWSGQRSVFDAVPSGTGTEFVDEFTAFVYTLTGGSQLAGFVTFSFLAYWGLAFIVKAAAVAVPGMAIRKYAWLCVVFPSIVYWPSSIGKEALVMLGLGVGTYGIAVLLSQRRWLMSMLIIALGLGYTALIRPHMSGIWLAAALPALMLAALLGARSLTTGSDQRTVGRFGVLVVLVLGVVGLALMASATVEFLQPGNEESTGTALTQIFEETTRRTAQAGSNFTPPSIAGPPNWPYAVARTLTRPLPIEVRGLAQLISAAEIMAMGIVYAISWKRVRSLPRAMLTNPYVLFVTLAMFLGGLAFASFANLGVLTRQKSLLLPFMLLAPCLPPFVRRRSRALSDQRADGDRGPAEVDETGSASPGASPQLTSSWELASWTARTLGTDPRKGADPKLEEFWS